VTVPAGNRPDRERRRALGSAKLPTGDPVDARVPVAFPKDVAACPFGQPVPLSGAAAIRAENESGS